MSKKKEDLVEDLSQLSVIELAELKKALEDKWGVTASAPQAFISAAAIGGTVQDQAEESTDFQITIEEAPADKKIAVIKAVREITGLGLKEAKDLVESLPKVVKESSPKGEAEELKKKLEGVGAKVTLKGI